MNAQTYSALALHGFRRSGEHVYLPQCEQCNECVPIRIAVNQFQLSRSQKRTWSKNQDVQVNRVDADFSDEHFVLYRRYIAKRHSSGEMDFDDPQQYMSFLSSTWAQTAFYEFRVQQQLIGVAIVDVLQMGLSAVYTFFEPELGKRSLGSYAILWEIEETRRRGLPWLFLGYWVKDCKKMNYKAQYQPVEVFRHATWEVLDN